MEWRNWTELGGDLKAGSTPSIAGTHRRDLSVLARLANGHVGMFSRSTAGWFAWMDLGLSCRDCPAMTVQADRMIIAARGTDDGLWIGGFQQWTPSGGSLTSAPSIAAWKMDLNAEIFARGADATLQWFSLRGHGKAILNPSTGPQRFSGAPSAVAPGPNSIHVFVRREGDSHLIHSAWNYSSWSPWVDLGEVVTSSPNVVSRDINTLEVYFAGVNGALMRRSFTVSNGNQLVSAGPRQALAPVVIGDLAAATFGPWHVEVFHRQSNGVLARIYAEGIHASDEVGVELMDDQALDSSPSMWAQAQDTVVCAARNSNNQLVTLTAEDGFWGQWQNHGGFLDSDPVIVTRLASSLEVVARDNNQKLVRWSRNGSVWTGPALLPAPPSGWCLGQPRAFSDWQGGVRIVTRTNLDRLNEAVIGSNGVFQRWNDLAGGAATQQPELVHVTQNALPAPFPGTAPRAAIEAGSWVVTPSSNGTLRGRLFAFGAWGPWQNFSPSATMVRRPIAVVRELGFPFASNDSRIATANQAGWIGRGPNGVIFQQRMVWVRRVFGFVSAVVLDSTPWTPSSTQVIFAADPTGAQHFEPFTKAPGSPGQSMTHVFARSPQGHLQWVALAQPAPGTLDWKWLATNHRMGGDVAPLSQWSSYENQPVLIAAVVTTARSLLVGDSGIEAMPQRVRPSATVLPPITIRPIRPVRPFRPVLPRPFP